VIEKLIASLPSRTPQERLAMRQNAEKMAAAGDPKKAEQANALLEALDAFERQSVEIDHARLLNMGIVERIVEAFRRVPPTDTQVALIKAIAENPGQSAGVLSRAVGWKGLTWQMHFGLMAKDREAFIHPAPPSATRKKPSGEDAKFYCGMLCDYDRNTSGFTLKPDAHAAFLALGYIAGRDEAS
jgi:hypothetical protein